MDALRVRLASALEWLVAAAFLAATVGVGSLILRDLRGPTLRALTPAPPVAVPEIPIAVPPGAVGPRASVQRWQGNPCRRHRGRRGRTARALAVFTCPGFEAAS
jgi:hypothetical protein